MRAIREASRSYYSSQGERGRKPLEEGDQGMLTNQDLSLALPVPWQEGGRLPAAPAGELRERSSLAPVSLPWPAVAAAGAWEQ